MGHVEEAISDAGKFEGVTAEGGEITVGCNEGGSSPAGEHSLAGWSTVMRDELLALGLIARLNGGGIPGYLLAGAPGAERFRVTPKGRRALALGAGENGRSMLAEIDKIMEQTREYLDGLTNARVLISNFGPFELRVIQHAEADDAETIDGYGRSIREMVAEELLEEINDFEDFYALPPGYVAPKTFRYTDKGWDELVVEGREDIPF